MQWVEVTLYFLFPLSIFVNKNIAASTAKHFDLPLICWLSSRWHRSARFGSSVAMMLSETFLRKLRSEMD
jgi:hypothetical protein